jgi:cytoskeleton protein RodZ
MPIKRKATVRHPHQDLLAFSMSRKRPRASVGAKLKKARERHGLSLRQIADSTKISLTVLQGLERDEITNLPGGVLGRGYVRSFATAVKLDPEVIVAELVAQFPESSVIEGYPPAERSADQAAAAEAAAGSSTKIRLNESGGWGRVASVVALVIVLAGVMTFAAPRRWPQWDAIRTWAMRVPAGVSDLASGAPALATLHARSIQPLRPSEALALPANVSPPPVAVEQATPVPVATASKSEPVAPADAVAVSGEPLKMTLSANAPSWVIAWVDGKKTLNRLLDEGEQETLEASRELVVTAGNGGAIVMTLNESVTRPLGRAGKTVKLQVNHANLSKHLGRDETASLILAQ